MKLVTSSQMRKIEQITIDELGIPSIQLMENAAAGTANWCLKELKNKKNPKVIIFCGSGNNGGDGFALARLLFEKNIDIKVILSGNAASVKEDPAVNLEKIRNLEIPILQAVNDISLNDIQSEIKNSDLIVDAMLGTGLDRYIEGNYKQLIEIINNFAKYIIAVDIPSGIHSDTGHVMGCAVKANKTITFGFPKAGLYIYPGAEYTGEIHIEDIAIPGELIKQINTETEILTEDEARELLPVRPKRSNKGTFGKVMVFAGSNEMPGAASLTCSAAYITGAGLVNACVIPHVASVIHHWQREIVTRFVSEKNGMYCKESLESIIKEINQADVIVIGPGIGRSPDVSEFVYELIKIAKVPVVLDADALFAVSENINILKTLKAPCIISPHPGEMSRLTGLSVSDILNNITDSALNFSKEFNVVTLLKDANTIIANPNGVICINTTGNNALAKAGTGDVLTGMIAGFIAQGVDVFTAGKLGAYYHGKAGEAACKNKSNYSVTASDVLEQIPVILN